MVENKSFEVLDENDLMETEGGSVTVAIIVIGCIVLGGSAIVETFNGYQEEKRASGGK